MPQVIIGLALLLSIGPAIHIGIITSLAVFNIVAGIGFSMILGGVTSAIQGAFTKKPKAPSFSIDAQSRTVTARQAIAPWRVTYGRGGFLGGVLTFIGTSGSSNEFIHLIITMNGHQIQSFDTLRFDGVAVPLDGSGNATGTFAGFVRCKFNLGTASQAAFSDLITDMPTQWTKNHRQRGRASAYVRLKWNADKFPSGVPNITFDVHGHALVFDPRGPSTGYSENSALCLREFLTNTTYGLGATSAEIDDASFIAAANVCDEAVALSAGGSESRYTCNGSFETNQKPAETIKQLLTSMAGYLVYTAGKWSVYAGAWRAPTISLGDNDARDALKVQSRLSKRETCNRVKGIYVNPTNNWKPSDFPAYYQSASRGFASDAYLAEDGGERLDRDVELPFTISSSMAQRLAKIELERIRRQISVQFPARLTGYQLVPPDVVQITHGRFSWSSKTFEVQQAKLEQYEDDQNAPVLGVALFLREADSSMFTWSVTEELSVAALPTTPLPNMSVVTVPASLTLTSDQTTAVFDSTGSWAPAIKAAWPISTEQFVLSGGFVDVQFKLNAASDWLSADSLPGDHIQTTIIAVQNAQQYLVRVRFRNSIGTVSAWVQQGPVTVSGGQLNTSFGKNLVPNPSFEDNGVGAAIDTDISSGFVGDGWEVNNAIATTAGNFPCRLAQEAGNTIHSGTNAARISVPQNTVVANGVTKTTYIVSPARLPFAIGDVVRVSGWGSFSQSAAPPAGVTIGYQVGVLIFNNAGTLLGSLLVQSFDASGLMKFNQAAVTVPATMSGNVPSYAQAFVSLFVTNASGGSATLTATNPGRIWWDDIRFIIQSTAFDVTPINTSGQPRTTTSPLTQSGATTTVNVAASTWQFGDGQVSYNSGSVNVGGANPQTVYIYADDPTYSGGAVTYLSTPNPYDILGANGRIFFGKIGLLGGGGGATGTGGGTGGGGAGGKGVLS